MTLLDSLQTHLPQPRVYVAGPLSAQDAVSYISNLREMVSVGYQLHITGFAPYVPGMDILIGLQDKYNQMEYEDYWCASARWLEVSDAMYKIADSPGADAEEELAHTLNIPVFREMEALIDHFFPATEPARCSR